MVMDVDSTTDNIISFQPIDDTLSNRKLDYAEPRTSSSQLTKNNLFLDRVYILVPTQTPTKNPILAPSATPPSKHSIPARSETPLKVDSASLSDIPKMHFTDMPYIRPCNTASPSESQKYFDPLKLHHIFGCHRFQNPKHITSTADTH